MHLHHQTNASPSSNQRTSIIEPTHVHHWTNAPASSN